VGALLEISAPLRPRLLRPVASLLLLLEHVGVSAVRGHLARLLEPAAHCLVRIFRRGDFARTPHSRSSRNQNLGLVQ